ncbi:hypothetical protein ACQEVM_31860 [Streptomyces sp. CA-243310]|uniref:hypothetical protein n=1 Tax=Streptomyces sp. CA-243310 TaxID=3240056 RepID=UPI003D8C2D25
MDMRQLNAPPRASSRVRPATHRSGVQHVTTRHTSHYTVVGNHLAQHRQLSGLARGVGLYIQSLRAGSPVGIKALSGRFPEGVSRLASALRELEAHGYLERNVVRLPNGRMVTLTYWHNQPGAVPEAGVRAARPARPPRPPRAARPPRRSRVERAPEPGVCGPFPEGFEVPEGFEGFEEPWEFKGFEEPWEFEGFEEPGRESAEPEPEPEREVEPEREAEPEPEPEPEPEVEAEPEPEASLDPVAVDLLAGLRRVDARLLLSEEDVHRLAPRVSSWFERGIHPEAVEQALTSDLPHPLRHAASLLAFRLEKSLPPVLPPAPVRPRHVPPDPLITCDGCERCFRSADPKALCGDCEPLLSHRALDPAEHEGAYEGAYEDEHGDEHGGERGDTDGDVCGGAGG